MIDLQEIIRDDLIRELKEQHDKQMTDILIHPEVYKSMKYNRHMNIFEKLQAGWYWIGECFDEWCWQMTHDDGEFFNYLQSDYVKYEEDMYFMTKLTYEEWEKENPIDWDKIKDNEDCLVTKDLVEMVHLWEYQRYCKEND